MNRQSMFCHSCNKDFTVEIDMGLDGNHVFECPHCDHEHCRVVKDGVVTGERWDQRNGPTYTSITYTATAVNMTTSSTFTGDLWMNSTSATTYFSTSGTLSGYSSNAATGS